jgi:hypothetical protein
MNWLNAHFFEFVVKRIGLNKSAIPNQLHGRKWVPSTLQTVQKISSISSVSGRRPGDRIWQ